MIQGRALKNNCCTCCFQLKDGVNSVEGPCRYPGQDVCFSTRPLKQLGIQCQSYTRTPTEESFSKVIKLHLHPRRSNISSGDISLGQTSGNHYQTSCNQGFHHIMRSVTPSVNTIDNLMRYLIEWSVGPRLVIMLLRWQNAGEVENGRSCTQIHGGSCKSPWC